MLYSEEHCISIKNIFKKLYKSFYFLVKATFKYLYYLYKNMGVLDLEIPVMDKKQTGKIEYSCKKCKFKFRLDLEKNFPTKCPWCAAPIDFREFF